MLARGVEHDGFHARGQRLEKCLEPEYGGVAERVALLGARQRKDRDCAAPLDLQGFRQLRPLRHASSPRAGLLCTITFPAGTGQASYNTSYTSSRTAFFSRAPRANPRMWFIQ